MMNIPAEIRVLLRGTKLKTEQDIVDFWNRSHPMLCKDTPRQAWNDGDREKVKAFIHMLKSGDGSMT